MDKKIPLAKFARPRTALLRLYRTYRKMSANFQDWMLPQLNLQIRVCVMIRQGDRS